MAQFEQKTIEAFFQKYGVEDPDLKAKLLPEITDIIYDYNMTVVKYEQTEDEYRKKQLETEVGELETKIGEIFKDALS